MNESKQGGPAKCQTSLFLCMKTCLGSFREGKGTNSLIRPSGTFPRGEGWFTAQPLNSLAFPYGEGGLPQARRMRSFAPKISL